MFKRLLILLICALCVVSLAACAEQQQVPTGNGTNAVVITRKFTVISAPSRKISQVVASCAAGEEVVSGGFGTVGTDDSDQVVQPVNKTVIFASYPSSLSSWTVKLLNREDHTVTLAAHIQCTPLKGSQIKVASGTSLSAGITAKCDPNTRLLGGGFQMLIEPRLQEVPVLLASAPDFAQPPGWTTIMHRADGSSIQNRTVYAYAVCTSARFTSEPVVGSVVKIAPKSNKEGVDGSGSATCPASQLLLSAGFRIEENSGNLAPYLAYVDYSGGRIPTWQFRYRSLVVSSIEGEKLVKSGTARLFPVCGSAKVG